MAFELNRNPPRSVVDKERDIRIQIIPVETGPTYGERTEYDRYIYAQGALQFEFKVAYIDIPPYSQRAPMAGDVYGVTQPDTATDFILKNSVRIGLRQGLKRPPTEEELKDTLNIIQEGFEAWAVGAKPEFPTKTVLVFIVDNLETVAQRYPGRLPNYERWAQEYNKTL